MRSAVDPKIALQKLTLFATILELLLFGDNQYIFRFIQRQQALRRGKPHLQSLDAEIYGVLYEHPHRVARFHCSLTAIPCSPRSPSSAVRSRRKRAASIPKQVGRSLSQIIKEYPTMAHPCRTFLPLALSILILTPALKLSL
ncbi:MAG: hypothetical protein WA426_05845, partial [Silvibacterium sp.]